MGDFLYLAEKNTVINLDQVLCITFDATEKGATTCVSFANTERDETFGVADTEIIFSRLGLNAQTIMATAKKRTVTKPPLAFVRRTPAN